MGSESLSMPQARAAEAVKWYRQRWPWLLMAGPAIVVVAAFVTLWLALRSDDGLVVDDYYRRGLLINRRLDQADRGATHGALASVRADGRVELRLTGAGAEDAPASVRLRLVHPTRAGLDRTVVLNRAGEGIYLGTIEPLAAGRWLVSVEADAWRLPAVEAVTPLADVRLGREAGAR